MNVAPSQVPRTDIDTDSTDDEQPPVTLIDIGITPEIANQILESNADVVKELLIKEGITCQLQISNRRIRTDPSRKRASPVLRIYLTCGEKTCSAKFNGTLPYWPVQDEVKMNFKVIGIVKHNPLLQRRQYLRAAREITAREMEQGSWPTVVFEDTQMVYKDKVPTKAAVHKANHPGSKTEASETEKRCYTQRIYASTVNSDPPIPGYIQRSKLMSFPKGSQSVLSLEGDSDLTSDPYWNIGHRRNDGGSSGVSAQSSKRRKQNLSSYARSQPQNQNIFDADPFEAVMSDGMDASSSEWTGLPLAADRGQISPAKAPPEGQSAEVRHLDITLEDPFGNRDKSEEKTKKSKKTNGKMKSTFDDISLDELRRYRRLSGNTLWSLVQKRKMGLGPTNAGEESTNAGVPAGSSTTSSSQNSGSSANAGSGPGGSSTAGNAGNDKAMNKRLQQLWGCLPEKERRVWKSKAKRIMKQLQGIQKREASQAAAGKLIPPEVVRQKEKQRIANRLSALKMTTFNTGDLAAHIKLVGDGLFSIGQNLKNQSAPVAVDGAESILLDSLVCALPPLLALCNQVCGLDDVIATEDMCETLDSVAYLMPGLY